MKTMKKMLSLGLALVLMLCLLPYSAYGEGETAPVGEGSDVQTDEPAEKRVPSGPLAKQVPRRPQARSNYATNPTAPEYTCRPAGCQAMPENGLSPRTAVRPTCAGNMFIFSARGRAATHEPRTRRTVHRSPIRIYPARAFPPERPLHWR